MGDDVRADLRMIRDFIEQLYAVEVLEYHNKGLLAGDNQQRGEWRQCILEEIVERIGKMLGEEHGRQA